MPWWWEEIETAEALGMKPWELEEAPEYWIQRMAQRAQYLRRKRERNR